MESYQERQGYMLTKRQKEVLDFIKTASQKKGYSPSLEEIQRHFKFASVSTAHFHISKLQNGGHLEKIDNRARGITIPNSGSLISVPLLGTIAAGEPIEAVENREMIAVPRSNIPMGTEVYALRVAGNSMIDEGINNGDVVIIKNQQTAINGEKIVALIDGSEATLKKYYKEKNRIRLQPANPDLKPIFVHPSNLTIQGTVIDVVKNNTDNVPKTSFQDSLLSIQKQHTANHAFPSKRIDGAMLVHADSFEWLDRASPQSVHAIVTDPPYGVVEFDNDQLTKMKNGSGGVWRVPPSFDGHTRSPLPRFTALNEKERSRIYSFFRKFAEKSARILKPGGHVLIASNAFIAPLMYRALEDGGLEFRGQTIRLVRTLRGGDRPKNAEEEFADVCSLPRGCYEPWGIFRNKLPEGMRVQDCLRKHGTGGLRRLASGNPFEDLIPSERTSQLERKLAGHPSLKPQNFLRKMVYAALPVGKGVILDPFMGSGSTLAAANACGLESIGVEINPEYFELASQAVPKLSALEIA